MACNSRFILAAAVAWFMVVCFVKVRRNGRYQVRFEALANALRFKPKYLTPNHRGGKLFFCFFRLNILGAASVVPPGGGDFWEAAKLLCFNHFHEPARSAGVPPAGSPSVSRGVGTGGETPPEPAAGDGHYGGAGSRSQSASEFEVRRFA